MSSVPTRLSLLVSGLLASWLTLCVTSEARAQRKPEPGNELELIESTERNEDPLGLDESTGKDLDRAAASLPRPKPIVMLPSTSQGAALSSINGVRESQHVVSVKLEQGLAFVTARLRFTSTAKHAAELAYRLPLPVGAVVTRVRVCTKEPCLDALPNPTRALKPRAGVSITGEVIEDATGQALSLRLGPIAAAHGDASSELEAEVQYVAEAAWLGGRARFRLPGRGYDPNLAPTELHVESSRLRGIVPGETQQADAWQPLEVSASLPERAPLVRYRTSAPCAGGTCLREFSALGLAAPVQRPTWLLIDASPSMEGPARSRMTVVLAALLAVLPEATEMRAYAFAAWASELGRFRADDAPLVALSDATMLDLDAATNPSSALALARADVARSKPRIVVLSDGLLDVSAREREALLSARRQGAETWLVALGDTPVQLADTFTRVLDVAQLAESATHGSDLTALEDALRIVAMPTRPAGQRAGEQHVREQRPRAPLVLTAADDWLPHWLARDGEPTRWRSDPSESAMIAALPYLSVQKPAPQADTGLPKESVLSMLRTQLVPQARACLRTDRKGRADYAVGVSFHALFAEREVYEARVSGDVARPLRACLEAILPKLRVPAFSGRIRIRYPIYTEREAEPPVIELEPDLRKQLERAFSPARALP